MTSLLVVKNLNEFHQSGLDVRDGKPLESDPFHQNDELDRIPSLP
jgi:hypothetical protein